MGNTSDPKYGEVGFRSWFSTKLPLIGGSNYKGAGVLDIRLFPRSLGTCKKGTYMMGLVTPVHKSVNAKTLKKIWKGVLWNDFRHIAVKTRAFPTTATGARTTMVTWLATTILFPVTGFRWCSRHLEWRYYLKYSKSSCLTGHSKVHYRWRLFLRPLTEVKKFMGQNINIST